LEVERTRYFDRRLPTFNYAADRFDLELTRKLPPLLCHETPFFPTSY
jgi:hypothetical protein